MATVLTQQQIEAQIDRAIVNQGKIDAVEPRANKVLFNDGRIFCTLIVEQYFLFYQKP